MNFMIGTPFQIGSLVLPHRLIQGPLAGFSCAPFRRLFSRFTPPAYCVSEMISAHDVLNRHSEQGRYLYRAADEGLLCYQISGNDPDIMAAAAGRLEALGADLIDINCGCPKNKIRKKGAGSALLEQPDRLIDIVKRVRNTLSCPLTVKIRIQDSARDADLARRLVDAGADALIVHGRRWTEDYDVACQLEHIALIKQTAAIPVIVNGDIGDTHSLHRALSETGCDAAMIARAATGKPWLYQSLLEGRPRDISMDERIDLFLVHLQDLAELESEHQAVLQSKSLLRYYFRHELQPSALQEIYQVTALDDLESLIKTFLLCPPYRIYDKN
ncbi:tRNA dihydrouridine synthase [Legionella sp. CNM-4043-24]|uniref:tRNA dihydrouridine synthase n=1 Tax=Legionella sp. CNM-4043-24 TaxID=3421646 RepID=UPI00403A8716